MAVDVDVARRLQAARVLAGLKTREELAERINLPKLGAKTLGKVERGERILEEHEIPPVARALGVPVSFFTDPIEEAEGANAQLDRIEAKLDFILTALELRVPAEEDGPARVVEAVRDAAARAGALPEPASQESRTRR